MRLNVSNRGSALGVIGVVILQYSGPRHGLIVFLLMADGLCCASWRPSQYVAGSVFRYTKLKKVMWVKAVYKRNFGSSASIHFDIEVVEGKSHKSCKI